MVRRKIAESWAVLKPAGLVAVLPLVFSCVLNHSRPPENPPAPATDKPIGSLKRWYIRSPIENRPGPSVRLATPSLVAPPVHAWIGESLAGAFSGDSIVIDLSDIPPGRYMLHLAEPGADAAFASDSFYISLPFFVNVSNDWDMPINAHSFDSNLIASEELRHRFPELVMTHYAGPYAFTDSAIDESRKAWLTSWLLRQKREYDDEIGLHIHPYCTFVELADIPCLFNPEPVIVGPSVDGYETGCYRYDRQQFRALLLVADSIFDRYDIDKPVSFRAGGWTADTHTIAALAEAGYLVDASGCNMDRCEELEGSWLGDWLTNRWPAITDTTQPYYPPEGYPGSPNEAVLEIPNNGALIDYVDSTEMVEIFESIWDGGPLISPLVFSIGYHPDTWHAYHKRLKGILTYLESHLAKRGKGPVVYATSKEIARIWRQKR